MNKKTTVPLKASAIGILSIVILLSVYFGILTWVSDWEFAKSQFSEYGAFIMALAIGFGTQMTLYIYLKEKVRQAASKKLLAATGSTSTLAMISCCTHYLVNILPILGVTGLVTLVAQYQIHLFWVGILFNLIGIFYLLKKILAFHKTHSL